MSVSTLKGKNVPVRLWTKLEEVESSALDQLKSLCSGQSAVRRTPDVSDNLRGFDAVVQVLSHRAGKRCHGAIATARIAA